MGKRTRLAVRTVFAKHTNKVVQARGVADNRPWVVNLADYHVTLDGFAESINDKAHLVSRCWIVAGVVKKKRE